MKVSVFKGGLTRLLSDFANNDLSAFYFDIRKDILYCEVNAEGGFQTDKRRAYRTVLDVMFNALVRWLSPVLVFTTEEVWGTRFPDGGSVHLLEWPEIPDVSADDGRWARLRELRAQVTETIEPHRREKRGVGTGVLPRCRINVCLCVRMYVCACRWLNADDTG